MDKSVSQNNPEEKSAFVSRFTQVLHYFTLASSIICYAIIIYLLIFNFELARLFFTDYTQLQEFISPELKLPIFLISLLISTILSINPFAQLVPLTSIIAFFYGFNMGLLFGCVSFFVATFLTVILSRNLNQKMIIKIIGKKNWTNVKILADEEGILPFFIAYLFPIFPNAIISWVAGVTRINPLKLATYALIAQFPGIVISVLIGSGVVTKNYYVTTALFVVLVSVSLLLHKYKKNILALINQHN